MLVPVRLRRLVPGTRSRRTRRALLGVAALALVGGLLAGGGVRSPGQVTVTGTDRTVHLEGYGAHGSTIVAYEHGALVTVRFAIANRGVLPVTVEALDPFPELLGMLEPVRVEVEGESLPARLGPREQASVRVIARFDNCEYFTERAVNQFASARLDLRVLGVARTVAMPYDDVLLVRSPTIVDCPDRVLDRSAKQRVKDGTISGRG